MKPHPTNSKPRIAPHSPFIKTPHRLKPSPRQPGKGAPGRVMWQESGFPGYVQPNLVTNKPVLVLDLSPEARERRVEVVARLLNKQSDDHAPIWVYMAKARAVLASLGDTPAGAGRGK